MPFVLAMAMLLLGMVYIVNNYIRDSIYRKIFWEFYAFETEYISQTKIELPKNCSVPLYLKRECIVTARDTKFQWVPTDELVPTGSIMIGKKGVEWYEVVWNYSEGYVPVVITKMERIIPWRFVKRAYQ